MCSICKSTNSIMLPAREHNDPSARPQTSDFLSFFDGLGRGSGPRGEKMATACRGVDSQALATILHPLRNILVDLGPDVTDVYC